MKNGGVFVNSPGYAARILIYLGILLFTIGVIIYFLGDALHWLGNLPGDIRIERGNFNFYFPLTTMILISLIINIIIRLINLG